MQTPTNQLKKALQVLGIDSTVKTAKNRFYLQCALDVPLDIQKQIRAQIKGVIFVKTLSGWNAAAL